MTVQKVNHCSANRPFVPLRRTMDIPARKGQAAWRHEQQRGFLEDAGARQMRSTQHGTWRALAALAATLLAGTAAGPAAAQQPVRDARTTAQQQAQQTAQQQVQQPVQQTAQQPAQQPAQQQPSAHQARRTRQAAERWVGTWSTGVTGAATAPVPATY